jgi:hypothetical protein
MFASGKGKHPVIHGLGAEFHNGNMIFIQELERRSQCSQSRGASYAFDPSCFDERPDCAEIGFLRFGRQGGEASPIEGYVGGFDGRRLFDVFAGSKRINRCSPAGDIFWLQNMHRCRQPAWGMKKGMIMGFGMQQSGDRRQYLVERKMDGY